MQLKVYGVALEAVRRVGPLAQRVGRVDKDLARQLRRASASVALNLAEGETAVGGNRRARFDSAIGSARESIACLEVAEALGYLEARDIAGATDRMDHVIATLHRLARRG